jgi:prolyl-tRNA synthetase
MKDLYSFNRDNNDLDKFYNNAIKAYFNVFKKVGIGKQTYITFASGGSFSKFSHEFQTVFENGEDTIYIDQNKRIGINKEVYSDEVIKELKLNKANIKQVKATEVGNIFKLGTKYSKALNLIYKNEKGKDEYVVMGCYGIGPGRLIATIVETHNDEKGIIWPISVSPYQVHLISLEEDKSILEKSEEIYKLLANNGIEVLWDERKETSAGVKFHDADLIGIPIRLVISQKSLSQNGIEIKLRNEQKIDIIKFEDIVNTIKGKITELENKLKV